MSHALVELMCQRVSYPRLDFPAPDNATLERVYQTALRAPDHMRLRPWRYLVVEGDARNALGELMCQAALQDEPELANSQQQKIRAMPLRAPIVIVAVCRHNEHPKVPREEQVLSCGVGVGYMLLALQAEGFGGIWRTGHLATHSHLAKGLALNEHESLVGFLYLGTPLGEPKPIPDLLTADFFHNWNP